MNFSEFTKTLYPYYGNKRTRIEFVVLLTDTIMGGQPARGHSDGGYQNPLRNKDERTLLAYFNGERSISHDDASIILSSLKKEKFKKFIKYECSEDAQKMLKQDLAKIEKINENRGVPAICADLFADILFNLAAKNLK